MSSQVAGRKCCLRVVEIAVEGKAIADEEFEIVAEEEAEIAIDFAIRRERDGRVSRELGFDLGS